LDVDINLLVLVKNKSASASAFVFLRQKQMKEIDNYNSNSDNHKTANDPHAFSREINMNVSPQLKSLLRTIRTTRPQPPNVNRKYGPKGLGSNWRS
jgi:hypothetical protein